MSVELACSHQLSLPCQRSGPSELLLRSVGPFLRSVGDWDPNQTFCSEMCSVHLLLISQQLSNSFVRINTQVSRHSLVYQSKINKARIEPPAPEYQQTELVTPRNESERVSCGKILSQTSTNQHAGSCRTTK